MRDKICHLFIESNLEVYMPTKNICAIAKEVIEIETNMIASLKDRIDETFVSACHQLQACQGRIIVMGVGKSGHIAKKIAATLASTGSPAFFVHPSEAKHGDIGMITPNDVVLALSYSGESEEILAVIPAIKRLTVPLIALTGKPASSLARLASIHLDVSVEKEACPLGLAPTSSSTATLVMGDAIAMTLLHLRGFTEDDFARSHPGGALGKRLLLTVESIMHHQPHIPIVTSSATLKEALIEMTQKKLGMTAIVNPANELIGVFTDGDIRRTLDQQHDIHTTLITTVMSLHPKTIGATNLAFDALSIMETHQITALIAVNDAKEPIGIIHIHDILRAGVA